MTPLSIFRIQGVHVAKGLYHLGYTILDIVPIQRTTDKSLGHILSGYGPVETRSRLLRGCESQQKGSTWEDRRGVVSKILLADGTIRCLIMTNLTHYFGMYSTIPFAQATATAVA